MLYLDSSAIVKLIVREPESAALVEELRSDPEAVSSAIARVEVLRAARRIRAPRTTVGRAAAMLDRLALVRLDHDLLERAGELEPPDLRTLDALHLATALSLEGDLTGFVTYDVRLASAAEATGLRVFSPA